MTKPRVLIVEDEGIVAFHIRETLTRFGYAPLEVASSGETALAMAAAERPDLVIMDIKLKGEIDGIEAARAIRDAHRIPVVFLTAYTDESTLTRAKVAEPYGFIVKPFEERELKSIVEIAIHKHEMERQVFENREWLATTLRSIEDAVIVLDPAGRVKLLNQAAEDALGSKREIATEDAVRDALRPLAGSSTFTDAITGTTTDFRAEIEGAGDSPRVVEGTVRPATAPGHATLGRVVVFRDVTARRAAEISRNRLAAIVNASGDAIVSKSLTGEILTWNPGAERMYGYAEAEAVGRSAFMTSPVEKQDELREILGKIRAGEGVDHHETQRITKVGRILDVAMSVSPLPDETGKIIGAVFIARDLTESKRLDAVRERASARLVEIERLREVNRLKTDFINAAAHELRTPLTPIHIQLDLLSREETMGDPERRARSLAILSRNFARLTTIIDDILERSRVNAEASKFVPETTNLRELVEEATAESRTRASAAHVTLLNLVREDALVAADKMRLTRVISDLIATAVDSSTREGSIRLVLDDLGESVALHVIDSAAGLDAREIDTVFDVFVRGDTRFDSASTRADLFRAKDVVEAHGGRLFVESKGRGHAATFTLELPRLSMDPEGTGARPGSDHGNVAPGTPLT